MRDRDGKGEGKEWRVGEAKWEGGEREGQSTSPIANSWIRH